MFVFFGFYMVFLHAFASARLHRRPSAAPHRAVQRARGLRPGGHLSGVHEDHLGGRTAGGGRGVFWGGGGGRFCAFLSCFSWGFMLLFFLRRRRSILKFCSFLLFFGWVFARFSDVFKCLGAEKSDPG